MPHLWCLVWSWAGLGCSRCFLCYFVWFWAGLAASVVSCVVLAGLTASYAILYGFGIVSLRLWRYLCDFGLVLAGLAASRAILHGFGPVLLHLCFVWSWAGLGWSCCLPYYFAWS